MRRQQYVLSRSDDASEHLASPDDKTSDARISIFVVQVTCMASLGGILFGYDLGVISGALPWLTLDLDLSVRQQEMVVSILYVGGGIGAMLGGSICDTFGRKRAIIVTDLFFLLGAVILWLAPSYKMVLLGRVVVGFAVAVSGIADVSYLHEIAPVQWRGSIVSVNEACISLGFLLAFAAGFILADEGNNSSWRPMFGASGIIALVQMLGMANMPESPLWLQEQGRLEESRAAMLKIRGFASSNDLTGHDISREPERYGSLAEEHEERSASPNPRRPVRIPGYCSLPLYYCRELVFLLQQQGTFLVETWTNYKRQVIIAVFLAVTQQFCGQTNVLSYAPLILAGASGNAQSTSVRGWTTLSIGLVKFVTTVLVVWKIEVIGRRFLLLTGIAVIALGLLLLTIAFEATHLQELSVNEAEVLDDNGQVMEWAVPGVLLVVTGYSMSFGTLTWLLTSELFPTEIRGRALGGSTIVTYTCAALVTSTFISAQEWLGRPSLVFLIYLLVTCTGFLFALLAIPDTKEKSVADIEDTLDGMVFWKGGRRSIVRDSLSNSNPKPTILLNAEIS